MALSDTMSAQPHDVTTLALDTRFGRIEVPPERQWRCAEPLSGFEELVLFSVLGNQSQAPFLWLQSLEVPSLAFLMAPAQAFGLSYRALAADASADGLPPYVLVILRDPGAARSVQAHRLAPLCFDTRSRTFRQWVYEDADVDGAGDWIGLPAPLVGQLRQRWAPFIVEARA